VRFVAPAAMPGVELMVVDRSARLWRTYHTTYAIWVMPRRGNRAGCAAGWWYGGMTHTATPGCAGLIRPGEVHVTRWVSAPLSFWVLLLDPSRVARCAEELGLDSPPDFRVAQSDSPALLAALNRFHRSVETGAATLELESLLRRVLLLVVQVEVGGGTAKKKTGEGREREPACAVTRARDYLREHVADSPTLSDLATRGNLSRFHLLREFELAFGLPPHSYLLRLRTALARQALGRGLRPGEIDLGFADQSHFGRHFKEDWGVTPGEYVRMRSPGAMMRRSRYHARTSTARTF
jgi:AraC-like DNA-binding protein